MLRALVEYCEDKKEKAWMELLCAKTSGGEIDGERDGTCICVRRVVLTSVEFTLRGNNRTSISISISDIKISVIFQSVHA